MNMNEQTTRIVVNRIISHLNPVPAGAANELLQQPLADLERILTKLTDTREQENVEEEALARIQEAQTERAFDTTWGATLARVSLNGKRLCDVQSNRQMFESLLQPHERPSEAIYKTLALQFASKFSWETPQLKKTAADREAEFVNICHANLLSLCDANRQMHKTGIALENWAGASGLERAAFQAEAAQARQKFLINSASPSELSNEAKYQSVTEREAFQRAEAERSHKFVLAQQQQSGQYPPLPAADENGTVIDSRYVKRLSTLDFARFKAMCKRYGTAQITEVLRTPAAPAV